MLESLQTTLQNLLDTAVAMGLFLLALWIIYLIDAVLLRGKLKQRFGLRPRARFSPLRILFSPFLHVNRKHLAANSIPFFILGSLVMIQGQVAFGLTTLIIILVAGLGIWIFGKANSIHMGASGLILGYFGFLLSNVFFDPNPATILIAVIIAVLYLGLITQIVPFKQGVSTTGHLFGFLGGVLAAWISVLLPAAG